MGAENHGKDDAPNSMKATVQGIMRALEEETMGCSYLKEDVEKTEAELLESKADDISLLKVHEELRQNVVDNAASIFRNYMEGWKPEAPCKFRRVSFAINKTMLNRASRECPEWKPFRHPVSRNWPNLCEGMGELGIAI